MKLNKYFPVTYKFDRVTVIFITEMNEVGRY